jgi:hypothetical protein
MIYFCDCLTLKIYLIKFQLTLAEVAELVDALDSKSSECDNS